MFLNDVLKEFANEMTELESINVVELFFSRLSLLEGAIAEAYLATGRPEEYSRDQVEFSVRCGTGNDELLETPELKQYYRLKKASFSAMGFMYSQRVNDDLCELAWEAFQIAHPSADRAMFDRVRTGDLEAIASLHKINHQKQAS